MRSARIFNTYGLRMRPDDGRVVPTFVIQAITGEDLTVYGDGQQTRSFCYIDDTVAALRALMDGDGLQGEVVNVGRANENIIKYLVETVVESNDSGSELVYEPLPEGDPQRRCPDLARARRLLDWEPTVPFEERLPDDRLT